MTTIYQSILEEGFEKGREQGLQQGLEQGREQGGKREKRAIALRLLEIHDPETVCQLTGLSLKEVMALMS